MNTADIKSSLLKFIQETEDPSVLKKLSEYTSSLRKTKEVDWANDLPDHVIDELELSIREADEDDSGIPNSEMLKEARKSFPHLNL